MVRISVRLNIRSNYRMLERRVDRMKNKANRWDSEALEQHKPQILRSVRRKFTRMKELAQYAAMHHVRGARTRHTYIVQVLLRIYQIVSNGLQPRSDYRILERRVDWMKNKVNRWDPEALEQLRPQMLEGVERKRTRLQEVAQHPSNLGPGRDMTQHMYIAQTLLRLEQIVLRPSRLG